MNFVPSALRVFGHRVCQYVAVLAILIGLFTFSCDIAAGQTRAVVTRPRVRTAPAARLVATIGGTIPRRASSALTASASTARPLALNSSTASLIATDDEQRLFALINNERHRQGLAPLRFDAELCRVARLHSTDMKQSGRLSHSGSDGSDAVSRVRRSGSSNWRALGENVAFNQGYDDPVAFAVERWMKSEKHRANITNNVWTHAGLGIARGADGSVYFTQVFVAR